MIMDGVGTTSFLFFFKNRYLTLIEQYYYTALHILALPSPLVGCGEVFEINGHVVVACVMFCVNLYDAYLYSQFRC